MPILKDDIQILRVYEQSNSSQIVVALGRRLGQFRVMAKGARRWPKKGFEGGFDLLSRGEMLAYPRPNEQLWIFKEWDEHVRPPLGQSYRMLAAGSYLCELTEALTRLTAGQYEAGIENIGATASKLFDLLEVCADALAERGVDPGALVLNFTLNALSCEGILPDLEHCKNCETPFFGAPKRARGNQSRAPHPTPPGPVRAWMSYDGPECQTCFRERHEGAPSAHANDFARAERGVWLGPEAHRALLYIQKTLKPLKTSDAAAAQMATTLALLVHGAIERDLRTLPYAMSLIRKPAGGSR